MDLVKYGLNAGLGFDPIEISSAAISGPESLMPSNSSNKASSSLAVGALAIEEHVAEA